MVGDAVAQLTKLQVGGWVGVAARVHVRAVKEQRAVRGGAGGKGAGGGARFVYL